MPSSLAYFPLSHLISRLTIYRRFHGPVQRLGHVVDLSTTATTAVRFAAITRRRALPRARRPSYLGVHDALEKGGGAHPESPRSARAVRPLAPRRRPCAPRRNRPRASLSLHRTSADRSRIVPRQELRISIPVATPWCARRSRFGAPPRALACPLLARLLRAVIEQQREHVIAEPSARTASHPAPARRARGARGRRRCRVEKSRRLVDRGRPGVAFREAPGAPAADYSAGFAGRSRSGAIRLSSTNAFHLGVRQWQCARGEMAQRTVRETQAPGWLDVIRRGLLDSLRNAFAA